MKIRTSSYFLMGIIAFMLFFGGYALTYGSIRMSAVPLVACGLVVVLGVVQLRDELIKEENDKEANDLQAKDITKGDGSEVRKYVRAVLWLAGLVLAIYLSGFLIATALFILAYLKKEGRTGWLVSIASAAIATILIYLTFVSMMQVDLFPGIFFEG
jgi:hypothetical protein